MQIYRNKQFEHFTDRDSGAVLADAEFHNCYFQGCALSITDDPEKRCIIRNVKLVNCSQRGCSIDPAIVEDVLVDGFGTHGQAVQIWGAVFNRVVLRGNIDRLMISSVVDVMGDKPHVQHAFDEANAEYYRHVDWALDISQAEFKELDIRGLPARLIRRDPETQIVVTREKAAEGKWRDLPFREGLWRSWLTSFLRADEADVVLVAPKRHRKFRNYLADLKLLQEAGVAEPD